MITKLTNWHFTKKSLPYWALLTLDSLIVLSSGYVGNYIDLGGYEFAQSFWSSTYDALITLLLFKISFRQFRTYSVIIHYFSFNDLQHVAFATLVGFALTYTASLTLKAVGGILIPQLLGIFVMFFVSTLLMCLERIAVKRMFGCFHTEDAEVAVIYSNKAEGISLANSIICKGEGIFFRSLH